MSPEIILIPALLIGVFTDLFFRKLPNWLTLATILVGIGFNAFNDGLGGLVFSIFGVAAGMACLIIFYMLGGMGAGDVKMMGGVGAFLGAINVIWVSLFSLLFGGLYAVIVLLLKGRLCSTLKELMVIIKISILTQDLSNLNPVTNEKPLRINFGLAIALGTISLLLGKSVGGMQ